MHNANLLRANKLAITLVFLLLFFLAGAQSAKAVADIGVPAYGQRYSFRVPSDINPYAPEITTTDGNGMPVDCGIACLSMIEAYHTGDYSENDYVYYRMFAAANPGISWSTITSDVGGKRAFPAEVANYTGGYAVHGWMSPEDILAQLNARHPVMVHRYPNDHWVVIYGYDGPSNYVDWGSFKIMNPYHSRNGGGVYYQHLRDFVGSYSSMNLFMYRTNGILPYRGANYGKTIVAKIHMGDGSRSLAGTANGDVVLELDANTAAQEWRFDQRSNSTYILTNLKYGTVMDLSGGGTGNGNNVGLYAPWDNYRQEQVYQRWYLYPIDGGYYRLSPEAAISRSLDAVNINLTPGVSLQIYDSNTSAAQLLTLELITDPILEGIACSQSRLVLNQGESKQLSVTYTPAEGVPQKKRGIIWKSSDERVAVVDSTGYVSARGNGTCTITATSVYNDSFSSACTVTVENGIELPAITNLTVSGSVVHLSWSDSPLMNANDVRAYEVFVYAKGNDDDCVWYSGNITDTSCRISISESGEYKAYVRAVNQTDGSCSGFSSREFMVFDDEWIYLDELPDDLPDVEIQYLNHYDDREQLESPGEGWTLAQSNTSYIDGDVLHYEVHAPLEESDTLVNVGTFYYHYCDANNTVEHYPTDRFCYPTHMINNGQFDIVWQGADDIDPRFTVYRLKWNSGDSAGNLAKCPYGSSDAMALYYLGYSYLERTAVTTNIWSKNTEWSYTLDQNADSVSYRIRNVSYENRLMIPANTARIEAEAFMGNTQIQEVVVPDRCKYIGSRAFAGCTGLRRVYIPDGTVVENDAFEGCTGLRIIRTGE